MKTAEQLLKQRGLTVSKIHSIEGTYSTTDAMREYSNQQLAEFKDSIIETILNQYVYGETANLIKSDELIKSIKRL